MFNYVFGKLKLYFMLEMIKQKNDSLLIPINEESIKESQIKVLNPLK